jgi:NAD(P)-dependent dehydrogenase (short-subunit alcohol dehydrogenase family)
VADQPHEAWDRIVRTNLCGLRNLTRAPAPEPSPDRVDVDNLALGM